ncbi:NAD(P)-binding domain-containing protein [Streptomyces sp. NPDC085946]|uniref:NAD(P)-binding domain-containing protein n=1 Tax=Streptomyces sp. NPDC085946 TaxID=3365744 RepID=UPI0037CE8E64
MARRIVEAGYGTTLWARRSATLAPFADTAGSPAELGAVSDMVCLCVVDDADVEQLTTGGDGVLAGMRPGVCSWCTPPSTPKPAVGWSSAPASSGSPCWTHR